MNLPIKPLVSLVAVRGGLVVIYHPKTDDGLEIVRAIQDTEPGENGVATQACYAAACAAVVARVTEPPPSPEKDSPAAGDPGPWSPEQDDPMHGVKESVDELLSFGKSVMSSAMIAGGGGSFRGVKLLSLAALPGGVLMVAHVHDNIARSFNYLNPSVLLKAVDIRGWLTHQWPTIHDAMTGTFGPSPAPPVYEGDRQRWIGPGTILTSKRLDDGEDEGFLVGESDVEPS